MQAKNEIGKSKRNVEHKLAQDIKSDSKSFYACARSMQNIRDRLGHWGGAILGT